MDKSTLAGVKLAARRAATLELVADGALVEDMLAFSKYAEKQKKKFDWQKGLTTAGVVAGGAHALVRKKSWSPTWMDHALVKGHKLHTPSRVALGAAGGGGIASIPSMVKNPISKSKKRDDGEKNASQQQAPQPKPQLAAGMLAKDFAAGIDPFGNWTSGYGQQGERQGMSGGQHAARMTTGVAGGLVGGGLMLPSAISGLVEGGRGLAKGGPGIRGKLTAAAKGAWEGTKAPIQDLQRGMRTTKALKQVASGEAKGLTAAQSADLQKILGQASIGDAVAGAKSMGGGGGPLGWIRSANKARKLMKGQVDADTARALLPAVQSGTAAGKTTLALGGAVGSVGAGVQYQKGRLTEREFQNRPQAAPPQAAAAPQAARPVVTSQVMQMRRPSAYTTPKLAAVLGNKPVVLTKTKEGILLNWEKRERSGQTNPLDSTNLERVSYNPGRSTLTVEFRKGGLYRYTGVPPDVVEQLLKAESHGKSFHENIKKPGYAYKRLI